MCSTSAGYLRTNTNNPQSTTSGHESQLDQPEEEPSTASPSTDSEQHLSNTKVERGDSGTPWSLFSWLWNQKPAEEVEVPEVGKEPRHSQPPIREATQRTQPLIRKATTSNQRSQPITRKVN